MSIQRMQADVVSVAILLFNIIALPIDSFDQCNLNFNAIGHTFVVDSFPFTRL